MLYLYYANIKKNMVLIITINSFGIAIETIYLAAFMLYAAKDARIFTFKVLVLFNFGAMGVAVGLTYMLLDGHLRITIVGWICAIFSICVFAAPLSIMRKVIRTKSVKYMPFTLSLALTLSAIVWLQYGLLIHDYYVAMPNVLGFIFGMAQMILYAIYKKTPSRTRGELQQQHPPQPTIDSKNGDDITVTVDDMNKAVEMMQLESTAKGGGENDEGSHIRNNDDDIITTAA
ncbi:hypothetical protein DM860_015512 [Cuscuta australis]|uniref:Bidirectional sugar transporter SWEET n=1 Tax=Cuscuta australis TaxID=267555 RepID=A0A328DI36_9ASTE|nr:hypothetical protein DM860_015512 [Cuscuta australis]